jgi:uncharacterized integral membrane protein
MIRWLRYLFLGALALALLTVALANRGSVTLKALPDDLGALFGVNPAIELPLFLVIFSGIVAGILIGFVWEWFREHKHRAVASEKTRELARLERELAAVQSTKAEPQDEVLALIDDRRKAG